MRARYAALAALVLAGCGGGGASTTPSPATPVAPSPPDEVTLSVAPNPIVTTEGSGASRQLAWQTVLTETAGVGVTVNFINVTLRDAATGVLAEPQGVTTLSAADIAATAGSNQLTPSATLVVPLTLAFDNDSNGGRLEIAAQLTDANGNVFGVSVTASVQ